MPDGCARGTRTKWRSALLDAALDGLEGARARVISAAVPAPWNLRAGVVKQHQSNDSD